MVYLWLFLEFFKIGLFTFGGGYAMIPLIKEVTLERGWLSEEIFYDFLGVCESTPGPIAVNMATYVGSVQGGPLGAILATLGVVLPAFIIMLLINVILKRFIKNKYFLMALKGINSVVLGLILATGITMIYNIIGINKIGNEITFNYLSIIIFPIVVGVYFIYKLIFKKKMSVLLLILSSAIIGLVMCLILVPIL